MTGAFLVRSSGSPLENSGLWVRLNVLFGALFPGWPGECYWQFRRVVPAPARQRATASALAALAATALIVADYLLGCGAAMGSSPTRPAQLQAPRDLAARGTSATTERVPSGGWRTSSKSYPCAPRFRARSAKTVDRERMKA